jgi:hypothetical protein
MSDPSSAPPRDIASMHTTQYRRSYAACPCCSRVEQIRHTRFSETPCSRAIAEPVNQLVLSIIAPTALVTGDDLDLRRLVD